VNPLFIFFLGCVLVAYYDIVTGYRRLRHFLDMTPMILSRTDLERMKRVASRDMKHAFFHIVVLAGMMVSYTVGVITKRFHSYEGILGLVLILSFMFLSRPIKKLGVRIKTLPVMDPALEAEYRSILQVWFHSPWPTWKENQ